MDVGGGLSVAVIRWRIYDGGPRGGPMVTNVDSSGKLRGGHRVADQVWRSYCGGSSVADLVKWRT